MAENNLAAKIRVTKEGSGLQDVNKSLVSISKTLKESATAMRQMTSVNKEYLKSLKDTQKELASQKNTLSEVKSKNKEFEGSLKGVQKELKDVDKAAHNSGMSIKGMASAVALGNVASKGFELALRTMAAAARETYDALKFSVQSAIDWEQQFTSVVKTVDGTTEQLAVLEDQLRTMATEGTTSGLQNAHAALAEIAASAGQMGVSVEYIDEFTKVIAELALATDIVGQSGATSLAQFMNITEAAPQTVQNLGSAIAWLGNNTATTESQILGMAKQFAATGHLAGLTNDEILGIAAASSAMGIQMERGGSALSMIFRQMTTDAYSFTETTATAASAITNMSGDIDALMQERVKYARDLESAQYRLANASNIAQTNSALNAIDAAQAKLAEYDSQIGGLQGSIENLAGVTNITFTEASEGLELFADVAGMSAKEFAEAWKDDAATAFASFLEGLSQLNPQQQIQALKDLELGGIRVSDTVLRLAGNVDLFNQTLAGSGEAYSLETVDYLAKEAETRFATLGSQVERFKNKLKDVAITIGDELTPYVREFLDVADVGFSILDVLLGGDESSVVDEVASIAQSAGAVTREEFLAGVGSPDAITELVNSYTVQAGDTATAIANALGISLDELDAKLKNLDPSLTFNNIPIGLVLEDNQTVEDAANNLISQVAGTINRVGMSNRADRASLNIPVDVELGGAESELPSKLQNIQTILDNAGLNVDLQGIVDQFNNVKTSANNLLDAITSGYSEGGILGAINSAAPLLATGLSNLGAEFDNSGLPEKAKETATQAFDAFQKELTHAFQGINLSTITAFLISSFEENAPTVADGLVTALQTGIDNVVPRIGIILGNALGSAIKAGFENPKILLAGIFGLQLLGTYLFIHGLPLLVEGATKLVAGFMDGIGQAITGSDKTPITDAVNNLFDADIIGTLEDVDWDAAWAGLKIKIGDAIHDFAWNIYLDHIEAALTIANGINEVSETLLSFGGLTDKLGLSSDDLHIIDVDSLESEIERVQGIINESDISITPEIKPFSALSSGWLGSVTGLSSNTEALNIPATVTPVVDTSQMGIWATALGQIEGASSDQATMTPTDMFKSAGASGGLSAMATITPKVDVSTGEQWEQDLLQQNEMARTVRTHLNFLPSMDAVTKLMQEVERDVKKQIQLYVTAHVQVLFGNAGGSVAAFAAGGHYEKGVPRIVGEKGIELDIPDHSGTIIPNHALRGLEPTLRDNAVQQNSGTTIVLRNPHFNGVTDIDALYRALEAEMNRR